MTQPLVYEVLASAFHEEGVTDHFCLTGDANMYFVHALVHDHDVKTFHARHEHCAVSMADGYYRATGKVGTASVTCGPGFTQIATALTMAARGRIPLVVFAGDSPTNASYHVQYFDPGPLTATTGAHYVNVRNLDRMLDNVREAFYVAAYERRPVVLNVPLDLQRRPYPNIVQYRPSASLLPDPQRVAPDPAIVEKVVEAIMSAKNPIIIGGRGAAWSGAGPAIEELADQCGALLGTSLLGKGLFDAHKYSIGIAGAFASNRARELYAECDLLIGIGAALGHYTTEGGYLYPQAKVVHIDTAPVGLFQGLKVADIHVKADAKAASEAILTQLRERQYKNNGFRTARLEQELAEAKANPDPKEYPTRPDVVDPRKAILELDKIVPKDWTIVTGSAHFFSIALTHLSGRSPDRYHVINDFGAIGSGLGDALGIAAGRGDGKVLLIEGDGSLMMHVQELETAARHNIRLVICTLNDGGYASEAHKFRAQGMDAGEALHGYGNLAGVAQAFGLRASTVTKLGSFRKLFDDYERANAPELWDVRIDDTIPSALFRRVHFGEF